MAQLKAESANILETLEFDLDCFKISIPDSGIMLDYSGNHSPELKPNEKCSRRRHFVVVWTVAWYSRDHDSFGNFITWDSIQEDVYALLDKLKLNSISDFKIGTIRSAWNEMRLKKTAFGEATFTMSGSGPCELFLQRDPDRNGINPKFVPLPARPSRDYAYRIYEDVYKQIMERTGKVKFDTSGIDLFELARKYFSVRFSNEFDILSKLFQSKIDSESGLQLKLKIPSGMKAVLNNSPTLMLASGDSKQPTFKKTFSKLSKKNIFITSVQEGAQDEKASTIKGVSDQLKLSQMTLNATIVLQTREKEYTDAQVIIRSFGRKHWKAFQRNQVKAPGKWGDELNRVLEHYLGEERLYMKTEGKQGKIHGARMWFNRMWAGWVSASEQIDSNLDALFRISGDNLNLMSITHPLEIHLADSVGTRGKIELEELIGKFAKWIRAERKRQQFYESKGFQYSGQERVWTQIWPFRR